MIDVVAAAAAVGSILADPSAAEQAPPTG